MARQGAQVHRDARRSGKLDLKDALAQLVQIVGSAIKPRQR
ncbi:MAG: hypothetical protein Q8Q26_15010 [Pseudorhodobacter sp.]|nr:hypothetical protein [Pseudorhodobacter sp.]